MSELSAFFQVVFVDIIFAGDNAIAVGLVAAALPVEQRRKVILAGIGLAVVFRVVFAVLTVQLLKIPGLLLFGGLLLLWVAWRLFVDLRKNHHDQAVEGEQQANGGSLSFRQALIQIVAADVSMSLDNVLAVAAIARDHMMVLVFGLLLSVVLMLVAATYIANLLNKHRWIAWLGIAIIFFVAVGMIWDGSIDIYERLIV